MRMEIFAIKDRAVNAYMQPFFAQAIGQAVRMFSDLTNDTTSAVNKHPDDYDLWHLGTFDDTTGAITPHEEGPQQIALGKNLLRAPNATAR